MFHLLVIGLMTWDHLCLVLDLSDTVQYTYLCDCAQRLVLDIVPFGIHLTNIKIYFPSLTFIIIDIDIVVVVVFAFIIAVILLIFCCTS